MISPTTPTAFTMFFKLLYTTAQPLTEVHGDRIGLSKNKDRSTHEYDTYIDQWRLSHVQVDDWVIFVLMFIDVEVEVFIDDFDSEVFITLNSYNW